MPAATLACCLATVASARSAASTSAPADSSAESAGISPAMMLGSRKISVTKSHTSRSSFSARMLTEPP